MARKNAKYPLTELSYFDAKESQACAEGNEAEEANPIFPLAEDLCQPEAVTNGEAEHPKQRELSKRRGTSTLCRQVTCVAHPHDSPRGGLDFLLGPAWSLAALHVLHKY